MEEFFSLTPGQADLLWQIKPIEEWQYELIQYYYYDNFAAIINTFNHYDKHITYEEFYYAGINTTPQVEDDDPRVAELHTYKEILLDQTNAERLRTIVDRVIKDFEIGYSTYEYAKWYIRDMIDFYSTR